MPNNISLEQPPVGTEQELALWLTNLQIGINTSFDRTEDMEITGQLPERVFNGMRRYFNQVLLPDITQAGAWIYEEGAWKPLTGNEGSLINLIEVSGITVISNEQLKQGKINIILVGASGSQITLPTPDGTKLVWVQQNFGGGGTFDVITP